MLSRGGTLQSEKSSLINGDITYHGIVNFSTAQSKYSFGKGRRFQLLNTTNTTTDFNQTLSSTFGKRSPTFGVGNRFGAPVNKTQLATPNPGTYTLKTAFEANPVYKGNTRTTNFKTQSPRKAHEKQYVPGQRTSPRNYNPGPGHYTYNNMAVGQDAVKFTLKPRITNQHEPVEMARRLSTPGPGQYPAIGMHHEGKYSVSTIPNSRASAWSPAKGKRFKVVDHQAGHPDMCTYNPSDVDSMHGSGNYIISKYRTLGTKKFQQASPRAKAQTPLGLVSRTPGPGHYVMPSEFGQIQRNISTADQSPRPRLTIRRNTTSQCSPRKDFTNSELEPSRTLQPNEGRPMFMNGPNGPPKFVKTAGFKNFDPNVARGINQGFITPEPEIASTRKLMQ